MHPATGPSLVVYLRSCYARPQAGPTQCTHAIAAGKASRDCARKVSRDSVPPSGSPTIAPSSSSLGAHELSVRRASTTRFEEGAQGLQMSEAPLCAGGQVLQVGAPGGRARLI